MASRAERLALLKARRESLDAPSTPPQVAPATDNDLQKEKPVKPLGVFEAEYMSSVPVPNGSSDAAAAAIDRAQESAVADKKCSITCHTETIVLSDIKSKALIISSVMKNITMVTLAPKDKKVVAYVERDAARGTTQCHVMRVKSKAKELVQLLEKAISVNKASNVQAGASIKKADDENQPWFADNMSKMECEHRVGKYQPGDFLIRKNGTDYALVVNDSGHIVEFNLLSKDNKIFFGGHPHDNLQHFVSMMGYMKFKGRVGNVIVIGKAASPETSFETAIVTPDPVYGDDLEPVYGNDGVAVEQRPDQPTQGQDIYQDVEQDPAARQPMYGNVPDRADTSHHAVDPVIRAVQEEAYGTLDGEQTLGYTGDGNTAITASTVIYGDGPETSDVYGDNGPSELYGSLDPSLFGDKSVAASAHVSTELYGNQPQDSTPEVSAPELYGDGGVSVHKSQPQQMYGNVSAEETLSLAQYRKFDDIIDREPGLPPASPPQDTTFDDFPPPPDDLYEEMPDIPPMAAAEVAAAEVEQAPVPEREQEDVEEEMPVIKAKAIDTYSAITRVAGTKDHDKKPSDKTPKASSLETKKELTKPALHPKVNSTKFVVSKQANERTEKSSSNKQQQQAAVSPSRAEPVEMPWAKEQDRLDVDLAKHDNALKVQLDREKDQTLKAEEAASRKAMLADEKKKQEELLLQQLEDFRQQQQLEIKNKTQRQDELNAQFASLAKTQRDLNATVQELFLHVLRERAVVAKTATKEEQRAYDAEMMAIEIEVLGKSRGAEHNMYANDEEFGFGMESIEQLVMLVAGTQIALASLQKQQLVAERQLEKLKTATAASQAKRQQERQVAEYELVLVKVAREKDLLRLKEKQAKIEVKLQEAAQEEANRKASEAAERDVQLQEEQERAVVQHKQRTVAAAMKQALAEEEAQRAKREEDKGKWRIQHNEIQTARKLASAMPPEMLFREQKTNPLSPDDIGMHPMIALSAAQGKKHSKDSLKRMWRHSFGLGQM